MIEVIFPGVLVTFTNEGLVKEASRFRLPSTPVLYEPEGMTKKSLEQEFSISPQALFHVMFGELSPLFQTLYAQRRAQGMYHPRFGRPGQKKLM